MMHAKSVAKENALFTHDTPVPGKELTVPAIILYVVTSICKTRVSVTLIEGNAVLGRG